MKKAKPNLKNKKGIMMNASRKKIQLSAVAKVMGLCQGSEYLCLTGQVLTGALKGAAVSEVEIHAIRHLLTVLIRDVWREEVGQRISFRSNSGVTICFRW